MFRFILLLFSVATGLIACNSNEPIVNQEDYQSLLVGSNVDPQQEIDEEIRFWQKRFIQSPDDIVARTKIAGLLTSRFSYSGNIQELYKADSLLQLVNQLNRTSSSSTFRSIAANCITKHEFRQAQLYIDSALKLGDDKYLSVLMDYDIALELGNINRARQSLNSLKDKSSFEFLIRQSKFKDLVEGNLDEAIMLMEQALVKALETPGKEIKLWTKSNLADLYGHANRYQDSYKLHLEVLAEDPHYYHSLKGIAWLAYSKDKNYSAAKEILLYLKRIHPIPDYDLMLSEIANSTQDIQAENIHKNNFLSRLKNAQYGDMYNKYIFDLLIQNEMSKEKALQLAKAEVDLRPTAETFSWLAWAYLNNGQNEIALKTVQYHVENKCFSPEAMYYTGRIYLANNQTVPAKKYLELAKESAFELGPVLTEEINQYLAKL